MANLVNVEIEARIVLDAGRQRAGTALAAAAA
jgi:hypothetical protein